MAAPPPPQPALFIYASAAIRSKYGNWTEKILEAVSALGTASLDASGKSADAIRERIHASNETAACLIGGYDLIPTFTRTNPTGKSIAKFVNANDPDLSIPTDAPYGAAPGDDAGEVAPDKAISRIPDGTPADAATFLKILSFQAEASGTTTPDGEFQEAAEEFSGPAGYVAGVLQILQHRASAASAPLLSPPETIANPNLPGLLSRKGRVHVLLHGADFSPDWAFLFGRAVKPAFPDDYPKALSAWILDLCDLRGSIVTFSSCYAAMLDTAASEAPGRNESNQVAIACLGHGAKVVIAATRANWIETQPPYEGYGPGLVAHFWEQLDTGLGAAEALRQAKRALLAAAMGSSDPDIEYTLKTLLQMQCYGHPLATL